MNIDTRQQETRRVPRRVFWGLLSLGLWVFLLVLPGTGWLMSQQIKALFKRPRSPLTEQRLREIVRRRPNDYAIQLGAALESGSPDTAVDRLRALLPRFPSRPALYAHILRYATLKQIRPHRPEEDLLMGDTGSRSASSYPAPSPAQLAAFDREAAAGERFDPKNAYFPLMRAIGLFALRRDAEALAALHRASMKPQWDGYIADDVHARWRLDAELDGRQSAVYQTAVERGIPYPHYAYLRAAARVAVYKAIEAERAGHPEEGLAIRRSLMRCGELLRARSHNLIGSLVGIAVTALATDRPGGGPAVKRPVSVSTQDWTKKRLSDYAAYVERIGHAQEVGYAKRAFDAGIETREIARKGLDLSPGGGRPLFVLVALWVADLIVLSDGLWMLLMGGAAALLARLRIGWAGFVALLVCGLLMLGDAEIPLFGWSDVLTAFWEVKALTVGIGVEIPLVVGLFLLIAAAVRRRAPSVVLSRGMVAASFVFALVYAGLLTLTMRQEARVSYGLERSLHGEGRYLAQQEGTTWPEVTSIPRAPLSGPGD